jgi:DNA invertase Pin-like site-specific DNA recombinase
MEFVGYARVSSEGQSLDIQLAQLTDAGCEKVFSEKLTGTTTAGRDQLDAAIEYAREGDVFVVTRLDRLARSLIDLKRIVDRLSAKGVGFRALQQGAIDTTRSDGRLMLNILASFAEFETDIRKERQLEGIAKAKAAKVYKGRKPSVPVAKVRELAADGIGPTDIAKRLGIGRASVYRALEPVAAEPDPLELSATELANLRR